MYTGYYFFIEHSSPTGNANQYNYLKTRPLWLAWYASALVVKSPYPWTEITWTDWQLGTPAKKVGQPTEDIDWNKSRYSKTVFAEKYLNDIPTQPPPPPTGGNMNEILEGTLLRDLNSRGGPGVEYSLKNPPSGVLHKDDKVYGIGIVSDWIHYVRIVRVGGAESYWEAWASAKNDSSGNPAYMIVKPIISTPPPSSKNDVPYSITIGDDKTYKKVIITGIAEAINEE
jgi:hypothetical protein